MKDLKSFDARKLDIDKWHLYLLLGFKTPLRTCVSTSGEATRSPKGSVGPWDISARLESCPWVALSLSQKFDFISVVDLMDFSGTYRRLGCSCTNTYSYKQCVRPCYEQGLEGCSFFKTTSSFEFERRLRWVFISWELPIMNKPDLGHDAQHTWV